jgi:PAS domain S-box-containing protein
LLRAAVVITPLLLFAAVSWWQWRSVDATASERAMQVSGALAAHVQRVIAVHETMLKAALAEMKGRSPAEIEGAESVHEYLEDISLGITTSLILVQQDTGRILAFSNPRLRDAGPSKHAYPRIRFDGTSVDEVTTDSGETTLAISRNDRSSGLIAISLVPIADILAFYEGLRSTGRDALTLVRASGAALIHTPGRADPVGFPLAPDSVLMRAIRADSKLAASAPCPADGLRRIWGIKKVEGFPIYVLYGLDLSIPWTSWLSRITPVGLFGLLASAALLVLTACLQRKAMDVEAARAEVRAQAALAALSERLRVAAKAAGLGIHDFGEDRKCFWSPEMCEILGTQEGSPISMEAALSAVHPADRERVLAELEALQSQPGSYELEYRLLRPDGTERWVLDRGEAFGPADPGTGRVRRLIGTLIDITNQKQTEAAMRDSEARFRGIFEHAANGIAIANLEGQLQTCNPAFSAILGYPVAEISELNLADLMPSEGRETGLQELRCLCAGEVSSLEVVNWCVGKGGKSIWVHKHLSLLTDAGQPTGIIVLVTDMMEQKRHEEQIHLLIREVNHRSKNMLAVVQAIARQTAATKPNDFIQRFGERIQALSASQDLLVKSEWKGVDIGELAGSQLAHFKDLIGTRIEMQGPPLAICAPAAQTIGMALHELATNAGKYGALSSPDGRVEVGWFLKSDGDPQDTFVMRWCERDGPPVVQPQASGFGTRVISRIAEESLDAHVELNYATDGLSWRLECPASEVLSILRMS